MPSAVADVLRQLSVALSGLGEGWYLFGAQAALVHGSRRLTADVDVTLLPGTVPATEVIARLRRQGFSPRVADLEDFVVQTRVVAVLHDDSAMPVDVVLGGPGLEALFLADAEPHDIEDVRVPVASPEHLVVMKLLAGRDKDLDDAAAVVRATRMNLATVQPLVESIAEGLGEDDIRSALATLRDQLNESPNGDSG